MLFPCPCPCPDGRRQEPPLLHGIKRQCREQRDRSRSLRAWRNHAPRAGNRSTHSRMSPRGVGQKWQYGGQCFIQMPCRCICICMQLLRTPPAQPEASQPAAGRTPTGPPCLLVPHPSLPCPCLHTSHPTLDIASYKPERLEVLTRG